MASLSNAVGTQDTDMQELSCVLIPVHGERLLLPNVCVAEIVPWRRFKILEKGPTWCVGYVGWRGHTIPVVHFAGFGDDGEPWRQSSRCLVIMNRSRNPSAPAFYAIAAEGLPRMMQLDSEDLNRDHDNLKKNIEREKNLCKRYEVRGS